MQLIKLIGLIKRYNIKTEPQVHSKIIYLTAERNWLLLSKKLTFLSLVQQLQPFENRDVELSEPTV